MRTVGDIDFNPDDGLDAVFDAGGIKINDPVHCSVIGQTYCGHSVFFCQFDHVINLGQAVQKRIVAMRVKVYKISH